MFFLIKSSFIVISPFFADYIVKANGKNILPFPDKIAFFTGATVLALSSRIVSTKQCFLMSAVYIAYKVLQLSRASHLPPSQRSLDLSDQDLGKIPTYVYAIPDLVELNISHTKLLEVSSQIENLSKLEKLNLTRNSLKAIPKEICRLKNLSALYLGDNQLESIPQEISQLTNLSFLSLRNNRLTEFQVKAIGNLKKLKRLILSDNQLSMVSRDLATLSRKCTVDLSNNPLSPDTIQQLEQHIILERRTSQGSRGPKLIYSQKEAKASSSTLGNEIKRWLQDYHQIFSPISENSLSDEKILEPYQRLLEHKEAGELQVLLEKLRTSKDYKNSSNRPSVVSKVKQMLDLAVTNEQFCEDLFTISFDGSSSCSFKAYYVFCNIDIQLLLNQEGITDIRCAEILIGMQRKDLLRACADNRIKSQNWRGDPIFVYLSYENKFKERLELPSTSIYTVDPSLVDWISNEEFNEDAEAVLKQTTQSGQLVSILMTYTAWKKRMDAHNQKEIEKLNEQAGKLIDNLLSSAPRDKESQINAINQQRQEKIKQLQTESTERWVKTHLKELFLDSKGSV